MTEIERIEELRKQEKFYCNLWHDQKVAVQKKLFELLNQLNIGPVAILQPKEPGSVGIDSPNYFAKEAGEIWEVRKTIYFVDPEGKETYDFGSSFDLYITNKKIMINHGSCGSWGLEDKGQWTRLLLMKAIFEHQDDIVRELTPLIDMSVRSKLYDIQGEINKINQAIQQAKNAEEEKALLATLKPGAFLAEIGYHWEHPKKEDGSLDWDKGSYKEYHWYNIYKIVKVTDKNIICKECDNKGSPFEWITKHFKLQPTIWQLKRKSLFVVEDLSIAPPQDEDSK